VASLAGKLYALDTQTGCVHWRYDFKGGARASMTSRPLAAAPSRYALYVGDDRMVVRALDAGSGKELWSAPASTTTGGPDHRVAGAVRRRAVRAAVGVGGEPGQCRRLRLLHLHRDRRGAGRPTGKQLWKQAILDEKPHPTRKNAAGSQMYGPAGGAIWSAPTIDAKRGQLYVATGDSYTEVDHPTSDAVLAMDLKTGKIRWANQVLAKDNFMSGTINGPLGERGRTTTSARRRCC
jgi:polyvinyl alcohol dehydrogenase (cytochrome)